MHHPAADGNRDSDFVRHRHAPHPRASSTTNPRELFPREARTSRNRRASSGGLLSIASESRSGSSPSSRAERSWGMIEAYSAKEERGKKVGKHRESYLDLPGPTLVTIMKRCSVGDNRGNSGPLFDFAEIAPGTHLLRTRRVAISPSSVVHFHEFHRDKGAGKQ
jgi:hypothetical protein